MHTPAIELRRHYRASPEKIWRAWTDPQALSQWFGPAGGAVTSAAFDQRVGGNYHIAFMTPDGVANRVGGTYIEVAPHTRLVFGWAWHSTPERVSRISIDLIPDGGGTELHFVHDRFADGAALASHARAWPAFFDRLGAFLHTTVTEA
jgi:uncharacterized protein YndB with AHSA1/START domain